MTTKNDMQNPRGTDYEHWKPAQPPHPQRCEYRNKCYLRFTCTDIPPCATHTSASSQRIEQVFTITQEGLVECQSYTDEEYPYCNDRAEPCRFKNRKKCPDYKSVIHKQVECDVVQGTFFAQQMVKDAPLQAGDKE